MLLKQNTTKSRFFLFPASKYQSQGVEGRTHNVTLLGLGLEWWIPDTKHYQNGSKMKYN